MTTESTGRTAEEIKELAEGQRAFWNSASGDKWVKNQLKIDYQMEALTDLLFDDAAVQPGEKVIDIGCGAGTTTRRLGEATGAEGQVLGLDISQPLLAAARAQTQAPQVSYLEGDAGSLDLPLSEVDLIFSRFGVMFFADPVAAFSHLRESLRTGGRLAFVCWAEGKANALFALPLAVVEEIYGPQQLFGPRTPGPLAFSDPAYITEILQGAGFSELDITSRDVMMTAGTDPQVAAEFMINMGPSSRVIAQQNPDPSQVQNMTNTLALRLEAYQNPLEILLPAKLHYVRAKA
ncbi:class I SAM-dependent methyltransferase [Rhodovibrionaceae bacterium A322]